MAKTQPTMSAAQQRLMQRGAAKDPDTAPAAEKPTYERVPDPSPAPSAVRRAPSRPNEPRDRPDRAGAKIISGYFPTEMSMQLRAIALEEGSTLVAIMEEAFNDLILKRGRKK